MNISLCPSAPREKDPSTKNVLEVLTVSSEPCARLEESQNNMSGLCRLVGDPAPGEAVLCSWQLQSPWRDLHVLDARCARQRGTVPFLDVASVAGGGSIWASGNQRGLEGAAQLWTRVVISLGLSFHFIPSGMGPMCEVPAPYLARSTAEIPFLPLLAGATLPPRHGTDHPLQCVSLFLTASLAAPEGQRFLSVLFAAVSPALGT